METKEAISLENFSEVFFEVFPNFVGHPVFGDTDGYKDTPYLLAGVAGRSLSMMKPTKGLPRLNEEESLRVINWVNGLWNDPSVTEDVKEMFWVEFLEPINTDEHRNFLMKNLTDRANLNLRQYLYIVENGGLTDPKTGEILKYIENKPSERTGKYIGDIR